MTTLQNAARLAAEEIALATGHEVESVLSFLNYHLAPLEAELNELESKRVDSIRLEQVVEEASKLFPDDKGLPDPCDDAAYRIRKAQAELPRWEDISKAPLDGTEVDLWLPKFGRMTACRWMSTESEDCSWTGWHQFIRDEEGKLDWFQPLAFILSEPTHFMPIPKGPGE